MKKNIFSYDKLPSLVGSVAVKSEFQTMANFVLDGDFSSKDIVSAPILSEGQTC
jgi:hypothetical protein